MKWRGGWENWGVLRNQCLWVKIWICTVNTDHNMKYHAIIICKDQGGCWTSWSNNLLPVNPMLYAENFSNVSFSVECTNSIQFLKCFLGSSDSQIFRAQFNINILLFKLKNEAIRVCVRSLEWCYCTDRSCDASMTSRFNFFGPSNVALEPSEFHNASIYINNDHNILN